QRELNAGVEALAVMAALVEEFQQPFDFRFRYWSSIRAPRNLREDRCGTCVLVRLRTWMTHEDRAPARRILGNRCWLIGTTDLHRAHIRVAHVDVVVGDCPSALRRMRKSFGLPQLTHE